MKNSMQLKLNQEKLPKVAMILHGPGEGDGTDMIEFVSLMIAFSENKIMVQCYAPDVEQDHIFDHVTNKKQNCLANKLKMARRNVLTES